MSDKRSKINFYHKHDTIKGCFYDCIVLHHKHFLKGVLTYFKHIQRDKTGTEFS